MMAAPFRVPAATAGQLLSDPALLGVTPNSAPSLPTEPSQGRRRSDSSLLKIRPTFARASIRLGHWVEAETS